MHPAGRNNPCGAKEQDKDADLDERRWYVEKTAENGWSRNVLVHQIESGLYQRQVLANMILYLTKSKIHRKRRQQ